MTRRFRVFFGVAGCVLIILAGVYGLIQRHPSAKKTHELIETFREFQSQLAQGNWPAAQKMLYAASVGDGKEISSEHIDHAGSYCSARMENRRLLVDGRDVTKAIIEARPRFWVTFDYMRQPYQGDKLILEGGYVLFTDGKIAGIKLL